MSPYALPGKWRELADSLEGSVADAVEYRDTLRNCADELAAAIAGGGEAVAVIGECAEVQWLNGGPCQLPPGARIFTHPAGAVQVSVEYLYAIAAGAWDEHQANCRITTTSGSLRKAVEAIHEAINPGGSRE